MSAEEALTLLLETSDQDTDAESDIDIISMQSPIIVGPQAVKIASPHEIDTTNAVYQNLEPFTLHTPQSSTFPHKYVRNTHQQSSPKISLASTPSPPSCVITQHSLNFDQREMPRKKPHINKPSSRIPVRCFNRRPGPVYKISSSETPDTDRSCDKITSETSDNERSSDCNSQPSPVNTISFTEDDSSRYLPPEQFPGPPKVDHAQKDIDEMDISLDNFNLGEATTQTKTHPNFLISKIPFRIMCMYINRYLTSIQLNPSKPEWPVPGMDKNQKCHFRRKVKRYS